MEVDDDSEESIDTHSSSSDEEQEGVSVGDSEKSNHEDSDLETEMVGVEVEKLLPTNIVGLSDKSNLIMLNVLIFIFIRNICLRYQATHINTLKMYLILKQMAIVASDVWQRQFTMTRINGPKFELKWWPHCTIRRANIKKY